MSSAILPTGVGPMAEQALTIAIQILLPLALAKFMLWPLVRPLWRWRRRVKRARTLTTTERPPTTAGRQRRRRQPPSPDPVEASYITTGPYAYTPLADELSEAVAILLVLYGTLGVDPDQLVAGINRVNQDHYLRAVVRIKAVAERLAEAGINHHDGTTDLAATGYLLEVADKLRGRNRMQSLS